MNPSVTRNAKLVVGISLCVLVFPVRTTSAPDWDVCVVDASGRPVPGTLVREFYQNYSAEFDGHQEDLYSDWQGLVHFSKKHVTAPLLIRLMAILYEASALAHGSYGPDSYVIAFNSTRTGNDVRNGLIYAWKGSSNHETSILTLREE
jgi:hypothetical protein